MTTVVDPENMRPEEARIEGTVFTPRQVGMLKVTVVVLGVMLLAGFAAVVFGMIQQASKMSKKAGQTAPAVSAPALTGATSALTIPEGGEVSLLALDGDRLAVHVTSPQGSEIAILDLATGKVLSRVKIQTAPTQ